MSMARWGVGGVGGEGFNLGGGGPLRCGSGVVVVAGSMYVGESKTRGSHRNDACEAVWVYCCADRGRGGCGHRSGWGEAAADSGDLGVVGGVAGSQGPAG